MRENNTKVFTESMNLKVGDIVEVLANQRIPADLVLLHTSDSNGTVFIKTDQLDGETDWKLRFFKKFPFKISSNLIFFFLQKIPFFIQNPFFRYFFFIISKILQKSDLLHPELRLKEQEPPFPKRYDKSPPSKARHLRVHWSI